jgi:peptidylprolyl isomerase
MFEMTQRNGARGVAGLRLAAALLVGCTLAGCGRQQPAPQAQQEQTPAGDAKSDAKPAVEVEPRFRQTLAEATRAEPPADWSPPEQTLTGKSVGKLYTEVAKVWETIRFVSPEGKRLVYHATLETDHGPIALELRPDWAPNHARNFLALAKVGYYDGLVFDRVIRQESKEQPGSKVELLEAGCPLGTGELGYGTLGYWLKPEFDAKLPHVEGVVGACHGAEADTACCKFYVCLCKAPVLDGNFTLFAKVTRGLDVARKISLQPVREDEQDVEGDHRPAKPVVIRKVTVTSKEVDKPGPGGDN